jgi:SAM-dependent methyltransferase
MNEMQYIAYNDIADIYNLAMKFGYYNFSLNRAPNIIQFYKSTDIYKDKGNKTILDLGCGTGFVSIFLANNDFDVIGIDKSKGMIKNAKINARQVGLNRIHFFERDATHFNIDKKIGLIISLFSVINHFENEEKLEDAFNCVYNTLDNGGYFIFDIFTNTYFTNHLGQMNYSEYVSQKFPIGSGVIEAACKVIIKQRMCNSGMRWTDNGAKNILVLRCFNETDGKWGQFWNKITKLGYYII